jgi:hypothetical protein
MKTIHDISAVIMFILLSWLLADLVAGQLRKRNRIIEYRQMDALP